MVFCIKFRNILVFCVHYFLKFTVHKQLNIVRYLLIEVRAMHASMLNRSNTFFHFFTACEVAIGNYQTIRDNKYFYKSEQFLLKFYNRFSFWLKKVMMGIKNPLSTGGPRGLSVIIYVYSMCTVYNVYLYTSIYLIQYSDKNSFFTNFLFCFT